jgi:hypothetical protein
VPVQRDQDIHPSAAAGLDTQKKLLADTNPAVNDTTKADFGTSTSFRYINLHPLATFGTSATPETTATEWGWHVAVADMNRDSTTKDTRTPAGTWNFQATLSNGTAGLVGDTARVLAQVFRRTSAGTYVFLFSAESADKALPTMAAVFSVDPWSSNQPEYRFDTGETLYVEYWIRSRGQALIGQVITFRIGGGSGIAIPQVRVPVGFTDLTYSAHTVLTTAVSSKGNRISLRRQVTGTISALILRRTGLRRAALSTVSALAARRLSLGRSFSALAAPSTARRLTTHLPRSATATAAPRTSRKLSLRREALSAVTVAPAFQHLLGLRRAFGVSSTAASGFNRKIISRRYFQATATWIGKVFIKLETRLLPPGGRGPARLITYPISLVVRAFGDVATNLRRPRSSQVEAVSTAATATCSLRVLRAPGGDTTVVVSDIAKEVLVTTQQPQVEVVSTQVARVVVHDPNKTSVTVQPAVVRVTLQEQV